MILLKPHVWEKFGSSKWPKMLSANQVAVFFDHQYLWKESIDPTDFLHGNNHQRKISSETITFGWVWPFVFLVQSDCRILLIISISGRNQQISFCMEIIIKGRAFLHADNHKGKVACETTSFGWVWPVVLLIQSDCRILWSSISLWRIKWS